MGMRIWMRIWGYAKQGWQELRGNWWLVLVVFLLQYLFSMLLLSWVKSVVIPLWVRFPGGSLDDSLMQIFLAESQFRLMKTDLLEPLLWALGGFVLVRMFLTPVVNSGLNYALLVRSDAVPPLRAFLLGVRRYGLPFLWIYIVQTLLLLAPLYVLFPSITHSVTEAFILVWSAGAGDSSDSDLLSNAVIMLSGLAPYFDGIVYVAAWLIWLALVKLACMYVGFGVVSGGSMSRSLGIFMRGVVLAVGLGGLTFVIYAGVSLLLMTISLVSLGWAGVVAMVIYLMHPFVRTLAKIWHLSAQQHLFRADEGGGGAGAATK